MSVETVEKDIGPTESDAVSRWFRELDLADKAEKDWRERGRKVVERYRSEQEASGAQFNILWSNTEVLRPALYGATPKPDVQRRYKDADPVGAGVARVLERALEFQIDDQDFDSVASAVVLDYLLPGRGVARVRYRPTMGKQADYQPVEFDGERYTKDGEEVEAEKVEIRDGAPFFRGPDLDVVVYEEAPIEYVDWRRFRMSPAAHWEEVRWVAFQSYMTRDELTDNFEGGADVPLTCDSSGKRLDEGDEREDFYLRAEVWEVWDKESRTVCVIAVGHDRYLLRLDDPMRLKGFFPVPRPLYAVKTNGNMIPVPEFCQYQDQADELNAITARIERIVDALRVRGLYDASMKDSIQGMLNTDENVLIPVDGWSAFAEKGGLDGVIAWLPIEELAKTLVHLYQKRSEILDTIYQLTGLSDIARGSTDPRETKGAQQLKAQFGTQRLAPRQREVARFVRDLMRLQAEVMAEHFQPQTLELMTGLPVTPEMAQVMRSDALRSFRVDIETDSTVLPDQQAEKEASAEFLTAVQGAVGTLAPLVAEGQFPMEAAKAILLAFARRNKFGREVESAFEMIGSQPPPQKPDPAMAKVQAEMQKNQQELEIERQRMQMEAQAKQQEMQMEMQKAAMELRMMVEEMRLERQKAQQEMALKASEAQQDRAIAAEKARADIAIAGAKAEHSARLAERKQ